MAFPLVGEPDWESVRRQPLHVRACIDGRKIGSLLLKRVRCDADFLHSQVWDTYSSDVDKEYQRLGIGAAMYGHLRQAGYLIAKAKYHSPTGSAFWARLASDLGDGSPPIPIPVDDLSDAALQAIWDDHSPFVGLKERTLADSLAYLTDVGARRLLDQNMALADWMITPRYQELARDALARHARWTRDGALLFDKADEFFLTLKPWVRVMFLVALRIPCLQTKGFKQALREFRDAYAELSRYVRALFEADLDGPYRSCAACVHAHGCAVKDIEDRRSFL